MLVWRHIVSPRFVTLKPSSVRPPTAAWASMAYDPKHDVCVALIPRRYSGPMQTFLFRFDPRAFVSPPANRDNRDAAEREPKYAGHSVTCSSVAAGRQPVRAGLCRPTTRRSRTVSARSEPPASPRDDALRRHAGSASSRPLCVVTHAVATGRVGPVFLDSPPSPPRPVLAKTDLLANIAFRARFFRETTKS